MIEQYYYYFMTAAGYKIWWKKYLTTLQITQFVIDLFTVYFASKTRASSLAILHFHPLLTR